MESQVRTRIRNANSVSRLRNPIWETNLGLQNLQIKQERMIATNEQNAQCTKSNFKTKAGTQFEN